MLHLLPNLKQVEQEMEMTRNLIRDLEYDLENARKAERSLMLLRAAIAAANS